MSFDPASLKYDANGLIPCIAQDPVSGEVLMMAWMNAEAVARTLQDAGSIHISRGRVEVLDGPALEKRACECHDAVEAHFRRLLPKVEL